MQAQPYTNMQVVNTARANAHTCLWQTRSTSLSASFSFSFWTYIRMRIVTEDIHAQSTHTTLIGFWRSSRAELMLGRKGYNCGHRCQSWCPWDNATTYRVVSTTGRSFAIHTNAPSCTLCGTVTAICIWSVPGGQVLLMGLYFVRHHVLILRIFPNADHTEVVNANIDISRRLEHNGQVLVRSTLHMFRMWVRCRHHQIGSEYIGQAPHCPRTHARTW